MSQKWFVVKSGGRLNLYTHTEKNRTVSIGTKGKINIKRLEGLKHGVEYLLHDKEITERKKRESPLENTEKKFKTEMAKEKYIKRKRDKTEIPFTVLRPTPYTICELYRSRGRLFSIETLGQMMRAGNVNSRGRYLVWESVGVVSGAIMFQTGGVAETVCVYSGDKEPKCLPLLEENSQCSTRYLSLGRPSRNCLAGEYEEGYFDTFFVCVSEEEDILFLFSLLPHIRLSGSVVIYSEYREVLVGIYLRLQSTFRDIRLTESSIKRYLHRRGITNPEIETNGCSGYLLSGTKSSLNTE
ncbi:MAG: Gcd10p-domain-containing protein [Amphiamblys sp. WSBS2006]|nr:MAG: Gcd10p-domain-containing protein [Amphiamblys sp. WSBS2006]